MADLLPWIVAAVALYGAVLSTYIALQQRRDQHGADEQRRQEREAQQAVLQVRRAGGPSKEKFPVLVTHVRGALEAKGVTVVAQARDGWSYVSPLHPVLNANQEVKIVAQGIGRPIQLEELFPEWRAIELGDTDAVVGVVWETEIGTRRYGQRFAGWNAEGLPISGPLPGKRPGFPAGSES